LRGVHPAVLRELCSELEGRYDADAHTQVVRSAALGGMNVLRVWGGGVFLPDVWCG
jgi:beta-mannosidase